MASGHAMLSTYDGGLGIDGRAMIQQKLDKVCVTFTCSPMQWSAPALQLLWDRRKASRGIECVQEKKRKRTVGSVMCGDTEMRLSACSGHD